MKKILSYLLVICIILTSIPVSTVSAAEDDSVVFTGATTTQFGSSKDEIYAEVKVGDGSSTVGSKYGDWLQYNGMVYLNGEPVEKPMWPADKYIGVNVEGADTVEFRKGTVFTDSSNNKSFTIGETVTFIYKDGAWIDKRNENAKRTYTNLTSSKMTINMGGYNAKDSQTYFYFNTDEKLPYSDWTAYGTIKAKVDGEDMDVAVGTAGNEKIMSFYFMSDSNNIFANATEIVIAAGTEVADPGSLVGLKFEGELKLIKKEGEWVTSTQKEKTFTNVKSEKAKVVGYDYQADNKQSYFYINLGVALPHASSDVWGMYNSITIYIDGEPRDVLVGGAGDGKILALYVQEDTKNVIKNAQKIMIPANTATTFGNDPTKAIKFVGDLTFYHHKEGWSTDATSKVKLTDIKSSKFKIISYDYQEDNKQTYFYIQTNEKMPLKDYSLYRDPIELSIDGKTYKALLGSTDNAKIFALYIQNDNKNIIKTAKKITIKDGTLSVTTNGDKGVRFNGAFNLYNTKYGWSTTKKTTVKYVDIKTKDSMVTYYGDNVDMAQTAFYIKVQQKMPLKDWSAYRDMIKVKVDGKIYSAQIASTDDEKIFAIYILNGGYKIASKAKKVVIPKGTFSNTVDGKKGIKFSKDFTLYNKDGWKTTLKTNNTYNEVVVSFDGNSVTGGYISISAKLKNQPDKDIIDVYGDWSLAMGNINMGTYNKKGKIVEEDYLINYNIATSIFYLDTLNLIERETITIKAGTVLNISNADSSVPIKIANTLRLVRDEKDEWVVDTEGSTTVDISANGTETLEASDASPATKDNTEIIIFRTMIVMLMCAIFITASFNKIRKENNK